MANFIFISVVVVLTILPIIFRRSKLIRYFCLLLIFLWIVIILHACLHLAARGAISRHSGINNNTFFDGAMETHKIVDRFLFPLGILCASLVLIGAVPREINKTENNKDKLKEEV